MKAWNIIWGILAAACGIAVAIGATHHLITCGICLAMYLAGRAEVKKEEQSHD